MHVFPLASVRASVAGHWTPCPLPLPCRRSPYPPPAPIPAPAIAQPATDPAPALPVMSAAISAVSSEPLALKPVPRALPTVQRPPSPAAYPSTPPEITQPHVTATAHSAVKGQVGRFSTARLSAPTNKVDLVTSSPKALVKTARSNDTQNASVASFSASTPFAPLSPFKRKKSTHRTAFMSDDQPSPSIVPQ